MTFSTQELRVSYGGKTVQPTNPSAEPPPGLGRRPPDVKPRAAMTMMAAPQGAWLRRLVRHHKISDSNHHLVHKVTELSP
jgi:hypothetical protein